MNMKHKVVGILALVGSATSMGGGIGLTPIPGGFGPGDNGVVWNNGPSNFSLIHAAATLKNAACDLVAALNSCHGNYRIIEAAQTLEIAADNLLDQIQYSSYNLDRAFESLEYTYNDLRYTLMNSSEIQYNYQARRAYFDVNDAYLRLRQAWSDHCHSGGNIGGGGFPGNGWNPGGHGGHGGGHGPGHGPGGGFGGPRPPR